MTPRQGWKRLPNEPLRRAYKESGLSLSEVCRRLGWLRNDAQRGGPNTSTLTRALGMQASSTYKKGKRYTSLNTTIDRERAKMICAAIGADFDDVYPMALPEPKPRGGRCVTCGELLARYVPDRRCGFCVEEAEVDQRGMGRAA